MSPRWRRVLGFTPHTVFTWRLSEPVVIPPHETREFVIDTSVPADEVRTGWTWTAWGLLWWR